VKREIVQIVDERLRKAYGSKEEFSELKDILKDPSIIAGKLAKVQRKRRTFYQKLKREQRKKSGVWLPASNGPGKNPEDSPGVSAMPLRTKRTVCCPRSLRRSTDSQ
jgi:hypothetical protein